MFTDRLYVNSAVLPPFDRNYVLNTAFALRHFFWAKIALFEHCWRFSTHHYQKGETLSIGYSNLAANLTLPYLTGKKSDILHLWCLHFRSTYRTAIVYVAFPENRHHRWSQKIQRTAFICARPALPIFHTCESQLWKLNLSVLRLIQEKEESSPVPYSYSFNSRLDQGKRSLEESCPEGTRRSTVDIWINADVRSLWICMGNDTFCLKTQLTIYIGSIPTHASAGSKNWWQLSRCKDSRNWWATGLVGLASLSAYCGRKE